MPCCTEDCAIGISTADTRSFRGGAFVGMTSFTEMHPYLWTKNDVGTWLGWCQKEYALSGVPVEKFEMNGKALCVLTKEDFKERAPNVGDVLYNTLHQFASTNLHPSFRNSLPQIAPMGSGPGNLLMLPAVAAAAAASMAGNGFLPATHAHAHAHLQQLFAKTTNGHYVASPMTPQASPSAPSSVTSGGRPSSPRNVTPDTTRSPVIVVTEATESSPAKTAAAEAGRSASSSPSPASRLQLHSRSPSRRTPLPDQSLSTSPKHIFDHDRRHTPGNAADEPLNLSSRSVATPITPSPPLLTPNIKSEPPAVPGAALQAAFRAYSLPKHSSSSIVTVSPTRHLLPSAAAVASPSVLQPQVQKFHQSGGTVRINPDAKFDSSHLVVPPAIHNLARDIKQEPDTGFLDLSPRPLQQQQRQKSPVNNFLRQHSKPSTPVTPASFDDDESGLETPFSPPITPGGSLLGLTPRTPGGSESAARPDGTGKLLWEFLSELLNDPVAQSDPKPIVRWIDLKTYTFQIMDTGRLSSLWGQQKNRGTMNYEKLSRALRYYKKVGIIEKATGKRLTYKFMKPPSSIKRGQRGARPGVPRKNRRNSVLQTQQSENGEENGGAPRDERAVTPPGGGAPMHILLSSGSRAAPFPRVVTQSSIPLTSANIAMLTGHPLLVSSPATSGNSVAASGDGSVFSDAATTVTMTPSPKPGDHRSHSPSTLSGSTGADRLRGGVEDEKTVPQEDESSTHEEEVDATDNGSADVEEKNVETDESERKEKDIVDKTDQEPQKAVHKGMPSPVPIYNPKSRFKSQLNSLCKRRLMSSSGEGSSPKKLPKLILSKNNLDLDKAGDNVPLNQADEQHLQ